MKISTYFGISISKLSKLSKFQVYLRFKHIQREDEHCSQLATPIRGEQWFTG